MTAAADEALEDRAFRILSLDGGGIKGVFSAGFLAGLEKGTCVSVADYFDLIVGTSTGGIIALGLGLGMSAKEIREFYREYGPNIFPQIPGPKAVGFARRVFSRGYSQAPLREALEEVFGDKTVGDSATRLVIVSYDGIAGDIHLLKTAHHPRFNRDYKRSAVDVGLATSAAPLYFPAAQNEGRCEIDGGVWANCPAQVGAIEALRVLDPPETDVRILSVGTTSEPFHVKSSRRLGGLLQWNRGLIDILTQAQVKGALAQAALLVGKKNFIRVDRVVERGRFSLDDASQIDDLADLGRNAARKAEPDIRERFLEAPAPPFEPYHG